MSPSSLTPPEFLDLQLDYWTAEAKQEVGPKDKLVKKDSKASLKSTFKSIQVSNVESSFFTFTWLLRATSDKGQKIAKLQKMDFVQTYPSEAY